MKKKYCFYCQKDVKPQGFLFWSVCDLCRHRLTDRGEGFYKVCRQCGANMPVDGVYCVKCGYQEQNNERKIINWSEIFLKYSWIINIFAALLLILFFVGLFYVFFYVFIFLAIFVAISFILNMFQRR